jgi:hypothetical protein
MITEQASRGSNVSWEEEEKGHTQMTSPLSVTIQKTTNTGIVAKKMLSNHIRSGMLNNKQQQQQQEK